MCLRAFRAILSNLQLNLDRLQPDDNDVPYAHGRRPMTDNPLQQMIRMHYNDYYNNLFM